MELAGIDQNLQFPEGVATAELLRAGSAEGGGAKLLGLAALAGAVLLRKRAPSSSEAIGQKI